MRRLLLIAFAVLLSLALAAAWFVQDANRFKPAVVAYIERETGLPVEIRGNLEWQLLPRLRLAAEDLYTLHDGRTWLLERLVLRPDVGSVIDNPESPGNWHIAGLDVEGLATEDGRGVVRVERLTLREIGLDSPAPLEARLMVTAGGFPPFEASLAGFLTVAADRVRVRDLSYRMPNASGICNFEAMPNGKLWPPLPRQENAILPLQFMRAYDWDGRCDLEQAAYAGETIENAHVVLDNKEGGSIVTVRAPAFLGGEAQVEMIVRADRSPVTWEVQPVLARVDSARLAVWLGGGSLITALVDYGGTIRMTGNTPAALASSVSGETRLATGAGELDCSRFLAPLAEAATLLDSSRPAPALPAMFDYEKLTGRWIVEGQRHTLDLALDGLKLEARADYPLFADELKLRGVVTLGDSTEQWGLHPGSALAGVPFHFQCAGAVGDPQCGLDARRTLMGAAASRGSEKADDLIEKHVPEEYREAARSLLDALKVNVDKALREDPDQLIEEHVPGKYQGAARSLADLLDNNPDETN